MGAVHTAIKKVPAAKTAGTFSFGFTTAKLRLDRS